jgi:hypothetical protein
MSGLYQLETAHADPTALTDLELADSVVGSLDSHDPASPFPEDYASEMLPRGVLLRLLEPGTARIDNPQIAAAVGELLDRLGAVWFPDGREDRDGK